MTPMLEDATIVASFASYLQKMLPCCNKYSGRISFPTSALTTFARSSGAVGCSHCCGAFLHLDLVLFLF